LYGRARPTEPAVKAFEEAPDQAGLDDALTVGELEDARLGFLHLLSRRFGPEFRERHGDDLFAQAAFEFSRKIERGEEIRNPAAWITNCGWNRAKTEMEAREWRPQLVPTDSLPAEPVAEPSWQPEEDFLSEDRMRKVRDAVDQLPLYQRELIARHYFEGESVREVSRQLGWSEGKGARAHNAARKKLRKLFEELGGPNAIALELGLAGFLSVSAAGRTAAIQTPGGLEAALQRVGDAISDGWHRAIAFARHPLGGPSPVDLGGVDPQSRSRISQLGRRILTSPVAETVASGGDGPGRVVEVCKVLAVCAISGTAVVSVGVIGADAGHSHHGKTVEGRTAPGANKYQRLGRSDVSTVQETGADIAVEPDPPSEVRPQPRGRDDGGSPARHAIAESGAAATARVERDRVAKEDGGSEEASTARETFSAFGARGEADPVASEPSSPEAGSISDAEIQSTSESVESSKAPPTSPKPSAENRAAQEQFRGALR
jgi:RNA polymerase sigma factor (sigma-70 family)